MVFSMYIAGIPDTSVPPTTPYRGTTPASAGSNTRRVHLPDESKGLGTTSPLPPITPSSGRPASREGNYKDSINFFWNFGGGITVTWTKWITNTLLHEMGIQF